MFVAMFAASSSCDGLATLNNRIFTRKMSQHIQTHVLGIIAYRSGKSSHAPRPPGTCATPIACRPCPPLVRLSHVCISRVHLRISMRSRPST